MTLNIDELLESEYAIFEGGQLVGVKDNAPSNIRLLYEIYITSKGKMGY